MRRQATCLRPPCQTTRRTFDVLVDALAVGARVRIDMATCAKVCVAKESECQLDRLAWTAAAHLLESTAGTGDGGNAGLDGNGDALTAT